MNNYWLNKKKEKEPIKVEINGMPITLFASGANWIVNTPEVVSIFEAATTATLGTYSTAHTYIISCDKGE